MTQRGKSSEFISTCSELFLDIRANRSFPSLERLALVRKISCDFRCSAQILPCKLEMTRKQCENQVCTFSYVQNIQIVTNLSAKEDFHTLYFSILHHPQSFGASGLNRMSKVNFCFFSTWICLALLVTMSLHAEEICNWTSENLQRKKRWPWVLPKFWLSEFKLQNKFWQPRILFGFFSR